MSAGALTQVLDLQELMVQQGRLQARHEVLEGHLDAGGVWIDCSCGRGEWSADEPASYRRYALHVAEALGLPIRRGAHR